MHTMHSGRMDIFQTPMGATLQTNVHHNSIAAFDFFIKPFGAPSHYIHYESKFTKNIRPTEFTIYSLNFSLFLELLKFSHN